MLTTISFFRVRRERQLRRQIYCPSSYQIQPSCLDTLSCLTLRRREWWKYNTCHVQTATTTPVVLGMIITTDGDRYCDVPDFVATVTDQTMT